MIGYYTYRAQDTGDAKVEPVDIFIHEPFPSQGKTVEECNDLHRHCGKRLADALCKVLPGGTLDALTAELLIRKATSLVVPR